MPKNGRGLEILRATKSSAPYPSISSHASVLDLLLSLLAIPHSAQWLPFTIMRECKQFVLVIENGSIIKLQSNVEVHHLVSIVDNDNYHVDDIQVI